MIQSLRNGRGHTYKQACYRKIGSKSIYAYKNRESQTPIRTGVFVHNFN